MGLTVLSLNQNYLRWVKPFHFVIKNCLQYQKKTTHIKPYDCSLKKDQSPSNRNIDQTVFSFDNKVLFQRKSIILNPFFRRIIKNLVKDNMRVFWLRLLKILEKQERSNLISFFVKMIKYSLKKGSRKYRFMSISNVEVPRGHKKNLLKLLWKDNMDWIVLSFDQIILKRQFGVNCSTIW